jgi:hypothetical protein
MRERQAMKSHFRRNGLRGLAAAAVVALVALPCAAHHSAAMFDFKRPLTLRGTVKELQWTNPHCFLQLLVPARGALTEWSVELLSPAGMYRMGLRPGSFKPGDKVTVVISPLKDGTSGGLLAAVIDANGQPFGKPRT